MITRFHIENFKSLVDFDLPKEPHKLGNFVCLVGMNGCGKTTVLQALDFTAQLVHGKMKEWLDRREWDSADLVSRIPKNPESRKVERDGKTIKLFKVHRPSVLIPFIIQFNFDGDEIEWRGHYNRVRMACTAERITILGQSEPLLAHENNTLRYLNADGEEVKRSTEDQIYSGSIISAFKLQHPLMKKVQDFMAGIKSFELLTPQAMRRRSRKGEDIGYGGEKLSAFLDSLTQEAKQDLLKSLQEFYPSLRKLDISTARGGWKRLVSREFQGSPFAVTSSHMNDGMLRVIAILAQAHSQHPVLLFDEIENGINPELVEKLVDFIVGLKKQIVVTTHSPMILNYLSDELATECVFLMYRDTAGWAQSVGLFTIPEVGVKLNALGPGEVFVDTNLTQLTKRLAKRKVKTEESA